MKTNEAAASYHPQILSAKYGQTGNETVNRIPKFVVCSKMTKPRS